MGDVIGRAKCTDALCFALLVSSLGPRLSPSLVTLAEAKHVLPQEGPVLSHLYSVNIYNPEHHGLRVRQPVQSPCQRAKEHENW